MRAITDQEIRERVEDLSRSWVMTSGAGCGKTYQMVQRYVAIIGAGVDVRRIIAVTFTEKAAAELKSRVRQRCREMIEEVAEGDRGRWEAAARQLAMAPVTTIHGLCARLLRENAVAAGVDPQFGQLDGTEQHLMLSEIAREVLLERLHAGKAGASRIAERWGLGGGQELLSDLVERREEVEALLEAPPSPEELLRRWRNEAQAALHDTLERALEDERWRAAMEVLRSVDGPPPGDKAGERILDLLEAAETAEDSDTATEERVASLENALASVNRRACGAKGNWSDRLEVLEEVREAFCVLADVKDDYRSDLEAFADVEDEDAAELASAIAAEASEVAAAYQREKQDRSRLDFADLQLLARDLLRDNPEVLARIKERYEHVLVDEFQDTNALQKEIIWLIAGGDSETGAPPEDGSLFVVGDAKQSIYGFRSAEVTVFNKTIHQLGGEEAGAGGIHLTRTRRSTPRLVGFFNELFSHPTVMGCEANRLFEAPYEPVDAWREQHPAPIDAELVLIDREELVADEDERVSARDARIREAEVLAARLSEIVESGQYEVCDPDTGEPRPARWGDIGILFRAMTNVGIYEYALRNAGVPFYTVAGHGFYDRQEIRDCLCLLQVLENASDEIALVGALRSPMFGIADDTIYWLTRGSHRLIEALRLAATGEHDKQDYLGSDQVPRLRRACEVIDGLRALKDRVALSELVERMLAETGFDALHLTQFAGRQALANLAKLTDLARSFEAGGEFSLREFISYLSDLVVEEHREGLAELHEQAADVVKLLTIHKAKGLQWPIVAVPDISRRPMHSGGTVVVDPMLGPVAKMEDREGNERWGAIGRLIQAEKDERETAESRRLLYVALTRARDMLLLSGAMDFRKDGTLSGGPWLKWVAEALELDCAEVADGEVLGGDRWTCRVLRPGPETGKGRTSRRIGDKRAEPRLIDEVLDAVDAGHSEPLPEMVREISSLDYLPARFSVTALQQYLRCPRFFYLRQVERIPEAGGPRDWLHGLSASERGNIVHHAMEILGRRGLEPGAIEQAVLSATDGGEIASRVDDRQRNRLMETISWVVNDARLEDGESLYRNWVAQARRLRAEVTFVAPLRTARVEGVIDAIVEDGDGKMRLLDYKTGEITDLKRDRYEFQIGLYCAAVRGITGCIPVAAALVLPDSRQVVHLRPEEVADRALQAVEEIMEGISTRRFDRVACRPDRCALAYACETA